MKANELRIGNLVDWDGRISTIDEGGDIEYFVIKKQVEPIPLTEEWLLKFGFKQDINKNYIDRWILNKNFYLVEANGYNYNGTHYVKCKQVHQLQNLYFALTGEELTINE